MNYPLPKILKIHTPEYIFCPEYKDPIQVNPISTLSFGGQVSIGLFAIGLAAYFISKRR